MKERDLSSELRHKVEMRKRRKMDKQIAAQYEGDIDDPTRNALGGRLSEQSLAQSNSQVVFNRSDYNEGPVHQAPFGRIPAALARESRSPELSQNF